jgi:hypothetical protein
VPSADPALPRRLDFLADSFRERPYTPWRIESERSHSHVLEVYFGDNLEIVSAFPDAPLERIYIDPPFNTGKVQART